jgi:hypothetical protein
MQYMTNLEDFKPEHFKPSGLAILGIVEVDLLISWAIYSILIFNIVCRTQLQFSQPSVNSESVMKIHLCSQQKLSWQ